MWIAAVVLSGFVALVFVVNGTTKLLGHPRMVEASTHLGHPMRSFRVIGLLQVLGAIGILLAPLWLRSVSPPRPASSSSQSGDSSPTCA